MISKSLCWVSGLIKKRFAQSSTTDGPEAGYVVTGNPRAIYKILGVERKNVVSVEKRDLADYREGPDGKYLYTGQGKKESMVLVSAQGKTKEQFIKEVAEAVRQAGLLKEE